MAKKFSHYAFLYSLKREEIKLLHEIDYCIEWDCRGGDTGYYKKIAKAQLFNVQSQITVLKYWTTQAVIDAVEATLQEPKEDIYKNGAWVEKNDFGENFSLLFRARNQFNKYNIPF